LEHANPCNGSSQIQVKYVNFDCVIMATSHAEKDV
jgi:hypothetical protein